MIDFESILPKRLPMNHPNKNARDLYNKGIEDCRTSLQMAELGGEICKPLSVSDIEDILDNQLNVETRDTDAYISGKDNAAHLIHRAMTNKGDV